jgi:hypothetical protein
MCTGEKRIEYRADTPYWRKRLLAPSGAFRAISHVHIAHGYSRHRREFLATCEGMVRIAGQQSITFSTGYTLHLRRRGGYIGILLGDIVWRGRC